MPQRHRHPSPTPLPCRVQRLGVNLRWAYIPAAVLLVLGLIVVTPFAGGANFVWALALIGVGAFLVFRRSQPDTTLPAVQSPAMPPATNVYFTRS